MTQASISLVTRPMGLADLEPLLYELTLAVNLSGIGSGSVAYPAQPLPTSWLASLNSFAAAVNAVTAFNTVTEATTSDPASLTGIVNTMIEEINAFVSGGGGYHADAVSFDGTSYLSIASLTATDSGNFGQAFWVKAAFSGGSETIWQVDPVDTFTSGGFLLAGNSNLTLKNGGDSISANSTSATADGAWHCVVMAGATNHADGSKKLKIYVDRVDVTAVWIDGQPAFILLFNGLPLFAGDDSFAEGLVGDIADLRIAPGQDWFTGADISSATLDLFQDAITLKPVDPAVATLALGDPAVLFSGDATTFGTNQGTGGTFTLTGSLTNASTSPSD